MGTVFHYISGKRDLIYLIFNDQAEDRIKKAIAALQPWQSLREKIISIAESNYQLLAVEPELGRILLSEIDHTSSGKHYLRHAEVRTRQFSTIELLIVEAQRSGELKSKASAEVISRTIFFAYSSAARWWINSPDPKWRTGLTEFRDVLDVILEGITSST